MVNGKCQGIKKTDAFFASAVETYRWGLAYHWGRWDLSLGPGPGDRLSPVIGFIAID